MGLQYCANLVIQRCTTDLVMRLDADDFLTEFALMMFAEKARMYPKCVVFYGNYYLVDEQGSYLSFDYEKSSYSQGSKLSVAPHGACTAMRTQILQKEGAYNIDFKAQDGWDIWLKLNQYDFLKLDSPVFYYRTYNTSLSKNKKRLFNERSKIIDSYACLKEESQTKLLIVPIKSYFKSLGFVPFIDWHGEKYIDYFINRLLKIKNAQLLILVDTDVVSRYIEANYGEEKRIAVSMKGDEVSLKIISIIKDGIANCSDIILEKVEYVYYVNFHWTNVDLGLLNLAASYCEAMDKQVSFPVQKVRDPVVVKKDGIYSLFNPCRFEGIELRNEDAYIFEGSFVCAKPEFSRDHRVLDEHNFTVIEEDFSGNEFL